MDQALTYAMREEAATCRLPGLSEAGPSIFDAVQVKLRAN
jgi:hypothetical protein